MICENLEYFTNTPEYPSISLNSINLSNFKPGGNFGANPPPQKWKNKQNFINQTYLISINQIKIR